MVHLVINVKTAKALDELITPTDEQWIAADNERMGPLLNKRCECRRISGSG